MAPAQFPVAVGGANVAERAQLPPSLAISTVIFALKPAPDGRPTLWLPLVRRVREPYRGSWALPGGPLTAVESLEDAARRNLADTTGLAPAYLEQLYAFGGLRRANRPDAASQRIGSQRVVSIVYWALVRAHETEFGAELGEERDNVAWHPAEPSHGGPAELAFDHREIVDYALWRLRSKIEYAQVAYHLLGEMFTLAQLREVHEAVLGRSLDPANFRRQLKGTPDLEATEHYLEGGRHRPPRLYRYTGPRGLGSPSSAPPSAPTTRSTS